MRKLLLLLLLSACTVQATTYYVDRSIADVNEASATPDYVTYNPNTFSTNTGSSFVYKTLADLNAVNFAAGDVILLRRGQSWAERIRPKTAGTSGHPIVYGAFGVGKAPLITGLNGNSSAIFCDQNYITFQDLDLRTVAPASSSSVTIDGATGATLQYCNISASQVEMGVRVVDAPWTTIYNCTIIANKNAGIEADGATTVLELKNTIISGNGWSTGHGIVAATNATINYDYNIIVGNNIDVLNNVGVGTDGGHNQIEKASQVTSYKTVNALNLVLTSDDNDVPYWTDIAATLAPYGFHFTMFVARALGGIDPDATALARLSAAGNEVAVHGWSHSELGMTLAFDISSINTTPTVQVDVAGGNIILNSVQNGLTYALGSNHTIASLRAALPVGWTITNQTNIQEALKLVCLADTGGAHAAPFTTALDVSAPDFAFWAHEVGDTLAWINGITGISPTVMAYPYGNAATSYTPALENWLATHGYSSARATDGSNYNLSSLNLFQVTPIAYNAIIGNGSEAAVRAGVNHYAEFCKQNGLVFVTLSHHVDGGLSIAQVGWIADEISRLGGQMITYGDAIAAIRADHSTADDLIYTKTYTDASDFHLLATSPAVNAGVSVGLTNDIMGTALQGNPDIGAYEYYALTALGLTTPADGATGLALDTRLVITNTNTSATESGIIFRIKPSGGSYSYSSLLAADTTSISAAAVLGSALSSDTVYYWSACAKGDGTTYCDSVYATDYRFMTDKPPSGTGTVVGFW